MKPSPRLPQSPTAWWLPVVLLMVIGIVYASQLVVTGHAASWHGALGTELAFWFSWSLVAWIIFRICRWLHAGPHEWPRYTVVLVLGAAGAVFVFPLLFQALMFAAAMLGRALSFDVGQQFGFWPTVRGTILNFLGLTMVLYVGTVLGWHAVTFYRDLKERKLKAVELESLLHQARLETLRSQLHPHFLFNTLHSIAELVHENPPLAEQLILRLAELLRELLKTPARQEVPLADEIKFIRSYLEIEQMRLGERLSVEWDIDQETLVALVPSLVLQPLVENAIQHGIAALAQPGRLSIRSRREQGFLHLQVRDTGAGLRAETDKTEGGIGLTNTKDRLQHLYGAGQRFELVNDNGLVVNVRIPFTRVSVAATPST